MRKTFSQIRAFAVLIIYLFCVPIAIAHSPIISGDNGMLTEAMFIPDPTKSWAIYGELHGGRDVDYYRFEIEQGQRIYISLMKPANPEDNEFMPVLALMGSGLNSKGNIPDYVESQAGVNAVVVEGEEPPDTMYEPFAPSSFYQLAELDIPAPNSGIYYIAVYGSTKGGHYSLAVGEREAFSGAEWILIPIKLISIYQWEGQSLFIIFLPIIAALASGIIFLWKKNSIPMSPFEWAGILSGLLFMGSGLSFLFQMALALSSTHLVKEFMITIILSLLHILLGIAAIRIVLINREKVDIRKRAYLAILGILALFVWAGFIVGSVLAAMASVMPSRKKEPVRKKI